MLKDSKLRFVKSFLNKNSNLSISKHSDLSKAFLRRQEFQKLFIITLNEKSIFGITKSVSKFWLG